MTNDNSEKPVSKTLRLCKVRDVSKRPGYEPFTPSVLRHLIFDAEDRIGSVVSADVKLTRVADVKLAHL